METKLMNTLENENLNGINPNPKRSWIESRHGTWYYPKTLEYNRTCASVYYKNHSETVKPKMILENLAKKGSVPQLVSVDKFPNELTAKKIWDAFEIYRETSKDTEKFPKTQKKIIKLQRKMCENYIHKVESND